MTSLTQSKKAETADRRSGKDGNLATDEASPAERAERRKEMEWLVYEFRECNRVVEEEYTHFDELEDAQEYANRRADTLRKENYEFAISIYELTNY